MVNRLAKSEGKEEEFNLVKNKQTKNRRKWKPTPVFLPCESHGLRSLAGPSPWGCREWERLSNKHRGASRLEKQLRELTAHQVASLVAQRVKHLPAMWVTGVRSLGQEDPGRRKWQPTPVFLPGESHGRRSLMGYSPRGRKESDTTERLHFISLSGGIKSQLHYFLVYKLEKLFYLPQSKFPKREIITYPISC